jgi:outer membrane protein assembly factor BamE (lipoprotein component of BamABCDE complex)
VSTQATQDSGAAAPETVDLGQTTDQVQAILGVPVRVANVGPKVIYYYNDMKVVFTDGKVTDVQ